MVKPVITVLCVGFFLAQSLMLLKAQALEPNGFNMENLRIRLMQRDLDKDITSLEERDYDPIMEAPVPAADDREFGEQLDYIEDNTGEGNISDNFVEAGITKRGNDNQVTVDSPCSSVLPRMMHLGENVFPKRLATTICDPAGDKTGCAFPYRCQEIYHLVPILKKKCLLPSLDIVPNILSLSWCAEVIEIPVGCQCLKTFTHTSN